MELSVQCDIETCAHFSHGAHNPKAHSKGEAPSGFPNWPYKRVHLMDNVLVDNIQQKIDQMQKAYSHQYEYPDSESDNDEPEDNMSNNDNNNDEDRISGESHFDGEKMTDLSFIPDLGSCENN